MTRGNNKHTVFHEDADFRYYLKLLAKYKALHPFDIYHYCLMPNHTHFLIHTQKAADFAIFMKKLNLAYFHYFNRKYGWVGHFWQGRYKSQPVGKDSYFIQCGKYIELNPVRKGIVDDPNEYRYSSYRHYSQGVRNSLVTDDFIYLDLSESNKEKQNRYGDLVIGDEILGSYRKRAWGGVSQTHNEKEKIRYHSRVK